MANINAAEIPGMPLIAERIARGGAYHIEVRKREATNDYIVAAICRWHNSDDNWATTLHNKWFEVFPTEAAAIARAERRKEEHIL